MPLKWKREFAGRYAATVAWLDVPVIVARNYGRWTIGIPGSLTGREYSTLAEAQEIATDLENTLLRLRQRQLAHE